MSGHIDTGDVVLHKPTGDEWLVAFVENGRLHNCGYPHFSAFLSDCELKCKATDEGKENLLQLFSIIEHDSDARVLHAKRVLAERKQATV